MRDCIERENTDKSSELIESYLSVYRGGKWVDQIRLVSVSRIGRDSDNHICLPDRQVSRHHCVVRWSDNCWELADLNSSNGTKLNGRKISVATPLTPGDTIRIGRYELGFVLESDSRRQAPMSIGTHVRSEPHSPLPKVVERVRTAGFFRQSEVAALDDSVSGGYAALYRLAVRAVAIQEQTILTNIALQQIVTALEADCGAIVLMRSSEEDEQNSSSMQCVSILSKRDEGFEPSQGVSELVLEGGEAILAVELGAERGRFDSVDAIGAESMMCVPIRVEQTLLGLIHIYRRDPTRMFTKRDLEWCLAAADLIGVSLQRIDERQRLTANLDTAESDKHAVLAPIVGDSEAIRKLRDDIERVAKSDSAVIIHGPSGAGKSLAAEHIHAKSNRAVCPLIRVHCAGMSESHFEQHFYECESTGQPAKISAAEGGCLYLEDVTELPLELQDRLADVLKEQSRSGDIRVLASTVLPSEELENPERLSSRLIHWLKVLEIRVPALEERLSDIPAIVERILEVNDHDGIIDPLGAETIAPLMSQQWPGNVRQLGNCVKKALAFARNGRLDFSDLPSTAEVNSELFHATARLKLHEVEKGYIKHVLHRAHGNKSAASNILGISRSTLDRKIGRYERDRNGDELSSE